MNQPWSYVIARYEEYGGDNPSIYAMRTLVQLIANSSLASGLFAWTSMFDLCVTQTEVTYPYEGPYLKISPLLGGQIEFMYFDSNEEDKQWHRIVGASEAVPRLLKFLDQLHWFPADSLRP
jgi:hypothetical protein